MVGNEFVLATNSPRWLYFSPDRFLSLGYVIEYMIINEFLDYKNLVLLEAAMHLDSFIDL